jgi:hypothetical protein
MHHGSETDSINSKKMAPDDLACMGNELRATIAHIVALVVTQSTAPAVE